MRIYLANDHRGVKLKGRLVKYLTKKGHEVIDLGTDKSSPVDYPEYAFLISEKVSANKEALGIAICGSGIGISIACNKVKGIRCARVVSAKEAKTARVDNDANIIALSGRTTYIRALDIVDAFVTTKHLMIERHDRRIKLISDYEKKMEKKSTEPVEKVKPKVDKVEVAKENIKIMPPIPKIKVEEKKIEKPEVKETAKKTEVKKVEKKETVKKVAKEAKKEVTKKESPKKSAAKKTEVKKVEKKETPKKVAKEVKKEVTKKEAPKTTTTKKTEVKKVEKKETAKKPVKDVKKSVKEPKKTTKKSTTKKETK